MSGRLVLLAVVLLGLSAAPGIAARSQPVRVTPSPTHPQDTIRFSWIARYGTDNTLDGYRLRFTGPGGYHCNVKTTYTGGFTWDPQDNARYRTHRVGVSMRSRREDSPPPQANLSWCPGKYTGRLVFRDYPFGKSAPIVYRFVGSFTFRVS